MSKASDRRHSGNRMAKLTPKQLLFVQEYLTDLNATQAAIRAGYSPKTAAVIGSENLLKPNIAALIAEKMAARAERLDIDADYVLKRLVDEVEADVADLYDDHNTLRPIKDWPLIWRQGLVVSVDVEEGIKGSGKAIQHSGRTTKLRFSDRAQRLVTIGKHVNVQAFKENVNSTGMYTIEDFVMRKARELEASELESSVSL